MPATRYAPRHAETRRAAPRRRRRRIGPVRAIVLILLVLIAARGLLHVTGLDRRFNVDHVPSWVSVQLVEVNGSGRRGEPIDRVTAIAIHYVGNPGTTAQQNRDYYDQPDTPVSSHFVIGLDGEVIQCVPLTEKSSATNERNRDTISIEVCHPDETGQFTQASYDSLVRLTAWLCDEFGLDRGDVIRHYDVTGKLCPLYFVAHPEAWEQFLQDVKDYRE